MPNDSDPSSQEKGNLVAMKYHACPRCGEQATLIVDVEETQAVRVSSTAGSRSYYCTSCTHLFAVGDQGRVVDISPHDC